MHCAFVLMSESDGKRPLDVTQACSASGGTTYRAIRLSSFEFYAMTFQINLAQLVGNLLAKRRKFGSHMNLFARGHSARMRPKSKSRVQSQAALHGICAQEST